MSSTRMSDENFNKLYPMACEYLGVKTGGGDPLIMQELKRARAAEAALIADNGALLELLHLVFPERTSPTGSRAAPAEWETGLHEEGCPFIRDETEDCKDSCGGSYVTERIRAAKSTPHFGAVWLEEHKDQVDALKGRVERAESSVRTLELQASADWMACCDKLGWARGHPVVSLPEPSRAVAAVIALATTLEHPPEHIAGCVATDDLMGSPTSIMWRCKQGCPVTSAPEGSAQPMHKFYPLLDELPASITLWWSDHDGAPVVTVPGVSDKEAFHALESFVAGCIALKPTQAKPSR